MTIYFLILNEINLFKQGLIFLNIHMSYYCNKKPFLLVLGRGSNGTYLAILSINYVILYLYKKYFPLFTTVLLFLLSKSHNKRKYFLQIFIKWSLNYVLFLFLLLVLGINFLEKSQHVKILIIGCVMAIQK